MREAISAMKPGIIRPSRRVYVDHQNPRWPTRNPESVVKNMEIQLEKVKTEGTNLYCPLYCESVDYKLLPTYTLHMYQILLANLMFIAVM